MKFELSLDAVKRIIFQNYNGERGTSLVDKDYKIWYNDYTQTLVLEARNSDLVKPAKQLNEENKSAEAPTKADTIKRNTNSFDETN